MEIRSDFKDVSSYIERLLSFSKEFSEDNKFWGQLKNQEDFDLISNIPSNERVLVERLYDVGRDMAIYMSDILGKINLTPGAAGKLERRRSGNLVCLAPLVIAPAIKTGNRFHKVSRLYHHPSLYSGSFL